MNTKNKAIFYAVLAALLYGIQVPFSKLLGGKLSAVFLAALLYLGAGMGMLAVNAVEMRVKPRKKEAELQKADLPFVILMIVLDIAAPILLLTGLSLSTAGTAALLGNFEIVATALLAMLLFREAVGKRIWISIALITLACMILSVGDLSADALENVQLSRGSLLVLLACVVWGLENNFTRRLSGKNPMQIVIFKGFGSGTGSLLLALIFGKAAGPVLYILLAAVLGFVAFGLSIYFYVKAQRELGAARTSAFYSAAPFMGAFFSFLILHDKITWTYFLALLLMLAGSALGISEKHNHMHVHLREIHEHSHNHSDGHHTHMHDYEVKGEHSHIHTHEEIRHDHPHTPDTHHRHEHDEHPDREHKDHDHNRPAHEHRDREHKNE